MSASCPSRSAGDSTTSAGTWGPIASARSSAPRRGSRGNAVAPSFIRAWSAVAYSIPGAIEIATMESRRTPLAASRRAIALASASSPA